MGMSYDELGVFGRLRKLERMGPVSMFSHLSKLWRTNDIDILIINDTGLDTAPQVPIKHIHSALGRLLPDTQARIAVVTGSTTMDFVEVTDADSTFERCTRQNERGETMERGGKSRRVSEGGARAASTDDTDQSLLEAHVSQLTWRARMRVAFLLLGDQVAPTLTSHLEKEHCDLFVFLGHTADDEACMANFRAIHAEQGMDALSRTQIVSSGQTHMETMDAAFQSVVTQSNARSYRSIATKVGINFARRNANQQPMNSLHSRLSLRTSGRRLKTSSDSTLSIATR